MPVQILLTGINHTSAPLEIREKVSFSREQLSRALPTLKQSVGEGVIVSTCNRTEIYTTVENSGKAARQIRAFLSDFHHIDAETLTPHMYSRVDHAAVHHLFRVSSGLDSMILGESQILGQIRNALTAASEAQTVEAPMVGLFHGAIRTGRRVREDTEISRNALSISFAGVQLAQRVLGDFRRLRALLVGVGEAGQLVAGALRTAGVGDLTIANRTFSRAEELASQLGGTAVPFPDLAQAIRDADIIMSATDSPEYVIDAATVRSAAHERGNRPQFYFDLAVPRDIDPEVTEIEGVELFNIDDLSSVAEDNLEERRRAAVYAEAIVHEELSRFMKWWESLDAVPIIRSLRQQAEEIRTRELDRALRMLPELDSGQREVVDALTRSIVNKVLHDPTLSLRQRTDKSQLQNARDLFRLWYHEGE
jgi:glutamyl-tRNA reductase